MGELMNRSEIILKTLVKLSYGLKGKITDDVMKSYMDEFKRFISRMKEDDVEAPKEFLKYFEKNIVNINKYEKEQVQEILAKAKAEGLINKSLQSNKYMERAWRAILKYYKLQGFILRS